MVCRVPTLSCVCEKLSDRIVLQYEGFHVDVVVRAVDGRQHRGVGGGAVLEQQNLVASDQRVVDDGFFSRNVVVEDVGCRAVTTQAIEGGLVLRCRQWTVSPLQLHHQLGAYGRIRCDAR